MNRFSFTLAFLIGLLISVFAPIDSTSFGQDIDHRKSNMTVSVKDSDGNAISNATVDVTMTKHAFQFGTQVRDRFFTITESEFNALNTTQKENLLPNLTSIGKPRYAPTWQETLNFRTAVYENFNHIIPTNGMQWLTYNNTGPENTDRAIQQAYDNGMSVTGHAVVWQNDGWPTPTEFRPAANPDPQVFHDALIADRLGPNGIMTRYSDSGAGPTVTDWDVLNEPIHEKHYANTFVNAGIYATENHALADYFIRADALRPDAVLAINEYNIISSSGDAAAREYRDLINDLIDLGAPIDQIKVQAHMGRSVSKADVTRRLDILAETGLPISISEFDMRDDAGQLSVAQQEQLFRDVLEATFEHESVNGFNMWGIWDPSHWRGNGPLFDENFNEKQEASAWFDLVRGDWMTDLEDLTLVGDGSWSGSVIDGTYDFVVTVDGRSQTFSGYEFTDDMNFSLTVSAVPEPTSLIVLSLFSLTLLNRRRRQN